jgi:hypothetical protein
MAFVQMQVYSSGGAAFMMIGAFLVPIAVAGTLAIGNTVGVRSATLRDMAPDVSLRCGPATSGQSLG